MPEKIVEYNNKKMGLRCTALTPRLYRHKIGRDIIQDLKKLEKNLKKKDQEFTVEDLEIFENVAFIMARQYDNSIPNTVEDWLDSQEEMFTIYELLPEIISLWQLNQHTTSVPKKL